MLLDCSGSANYKFWKQDAYISYNAPAYERIINQLLHNLVIYFCSQFPLSGTRHISMFCAVSFVNIYRQALAICWETQN